MISYRSAKIAYVARHMGPPTCRVDVKRQIYPSLFSSMYCLVRRSLSPSRAAESVIDFHAQRTPPRRRNARMSGRQDAAGPSTAAATARGGSRPIQHRRRSWARGGGACGPRGSGAV